MDIRQEVSDYITGKQTVLPPEAYFFIQKLYENEALGSHAHPAKPLIKDNLQAFLNLAEKFGCFDTGTVRDAFEKLTTYRERGANILAELLEGMGYETEDSLLITSHFYTDELQDVYKDKKIMDFLDRHGKECEEYNLVWDEGFINDFLPEVINYQQGNTQSLDEFIELYPKFREAILKKFTLNRKVFDRVHKTYSKWNDGAIKRGLYSSGVCFGCFTNHFTDGITSNFQELLDTYNAGVTLEKDKITLSKEQFQKKYNANYNTNLVFNALKDNKLDFLILDTKWGSYFSENIFAYTLMIENADVLLKQYFQTSLEDFDSLEIFGANETPIYTWMARFIDIAKNYRTSIKYPIGFVLQNYDDFINKRIRDKDFKGNVYKVLKEEEINEVWAHHIDDFYKFAKGLGCFTDKTIIDSRGKEISMSLRASTVLGNLMKNNVLELTDMHSMFDNLPHDIEPNPNFLEFIAVEQVEIKTIKVKTMRKDGTEYEQDKKIRTKTYPNLEILKQFQKEKPGMMASIMRSWDEIVKHKNTTRRTIIKDGVEKSTEHSWQSALETFYENRTFDNIQPGYETLASLMAKNGLKQKDFDKAQNTYIKSKENGMPEHLLCKHLVEDIENLVEDIGENLIEAKKEIETAYKHNFTYEMLNKYDPRNPILGVYAGCCGRLDSTAYGSKIALATISANNIQNLVIKNSEGDIISKGTIYLDRKHSYAVINDFELNEKYRAHEIGKIGGQGGYYRDEQYPHQAKEREEIFQAYMRGVQDFVLEYDKENPNSPLEFVVVGMGYNRLKAQCEQFEKTTKNFSVPVEYAFNDATETQYILYNREKILTKQNTNIKTGGKEL